MAHRDGLKLPPEIWREIAQYVPTECYRNILSVNQPLFDFVMNERYRNVFVRIYDWDHKTIKLLDRLQDNHTAGRVRCLLIHVYTSSYWYPSHGDIIHAKRTICEAVCKMSRLTEYVVLCSPSEAFDVLPEFTAFSPDFRQNLRTLDLSLPMRKIVDLNLQEVDFLRLESFALTTMEVSTLDQPDPEVEKTESSLITVLPPFLRRCRPTLNRLSISTKVDLDKGPFLDLLGVFPNLISVSLCFGLQQKDNSLESPVSHFVNRHAESLRNLVFQPRTCTALERIGDIFSKMALPHLQELKVGLDTFTTRIAILEQCIRPFTRTLTTIDLTQEYLSFEDLQIVSGLFIQEPPSLKTASLTLLCLSPRAVDLLADRLQGLQDLTILFFSITDDEGALDEIDRDHDEDRFCQEMEGRSYPNWHLRNVALSLQFCCGKTCSWKAMKVLAKALPSLRSFDGQGDLSVSEEWGDSDVYEVKEGMCDCIIRFDL